MDHRFRGSGGLVWLQRPCLAAIGATELPHITEAWPILTLKLLFSVLPGLRGSTWMQKPALCCCRELHQTRARVQTFRRIFCLLLYMFAVHVRSLGEEGEQIFTLNKLLTLFSSVVIVVWLPNSCSQVAFQLIPPTSWNGRSRKKTCQPKFKMRCFHKSV